MFSNLIWKWLMKILISGVKGAPAYVHLYRYPNFQDAASALANKSFFKVFYHVMYLCPLHIMSCSGCWILVLQQDHTLEYISFSAFNFSSFDIFKMICVSTMKVTLLAYLKRLTLCNILLKSGVQSHYKLLPMNFSHAQVLLVLRFLNHILLSS